MSTESLAPAVQNATPKAPVGFGRMGVELATLEDAYRFATAVSKSGFAPSGMQSVESILIAVQFGAELGLTPMSSLQSLAIINGRPSIYGDAALALVRGSGFLESYIQKLEGEGENQKAVVTVKRKGEDAIISEFSVADAKKAGLWGKSGPWQQYPGRMLMWRARGFALRDGFGDVLRGLATAEENRDLDPEEAISHAKQVNEPVPSKFVRTKKSEKTPETLPAETAVVHDQQQARQPEAVIPDEPPAKPAASEPSAPGVSAPRSKPRSTEPEPAAQTPAAEAPKAETAPLIGEGQRVAQTPAPQTDPEPESAMMKEIRAIQQTYGATDDDILTFAKEQGILSRSSRMQLADLGDNILRPILAKKEKLVAKFNA